MKTYACHNCRKGLGPHCIRCGRVDLYEKKLCYEPRADNVEALAVAAQKSEPSSLTPLPPHVEDLFLQSFCAVPTLSPVEALLLHHVAKGKTPGTFQEYLVKASNEIREELPGLYHRKCFRLWDGIVRKCPLLQSIVTWKGNRS